MNPGLFGFAPGNTSTVSSGGEIVPGNTALTANSPSAQQVNSTQYGDFLVLPNATTMATGAFLFNIKNNGTVDYGIRDAAGTKLGWIRPGDSVIVGLVSNATAAGQWNIVGLAKSGCTAFNSFLCLGGATQVKFVQVSATRSFLYFGVTTIYGVMYDSAARTWGNVVTIRSGSTISATACLQTVDFVTVWTTASGAVEARAMLISGTTITMGTPATASFAQNIIELGLALTIGTVSVMMHNQTTSGIVVSTAAITNLALGGLFIYPNLINITNTATLPLFFPVDTTGILIIGKANDNSYVATPYTVAGSGASITAGTAAVVFTAGNGSGKTSRGVVLPTGRWGVVITDNTTFAMQFSVFSVSSNIATFTTQALANVSAGLSAYGVEIAAVTATKIALVWGQSASWTIQYLTDASGNVTAGSSHTLLFDETWTQANYQFLWASATQVAFLCRPTTKATVAIYSTAGVSPVLQAVHSVDCAATTYVSSGFYSQPANNILSGSNFAHMPAFSGETQYDYRFTAQGITRTAPLTAPATLTPMYGTRVNALASWHGNTLHTSSLNQYAALVEVAP